MSQKVVKITKGRLWVHKTLMILKVLLQTSRISTQLEINLRTNSLSNTKLNYSSIFTCSCSSPYKRAFYDLILNRHIIVPFNVLIKECCHESNDSSLIHTISRDNSFTMIFSGSTFNNITLFFWHGKVRCKIAYVIDNPLIDLFLSHFCCNPK